MLFISTLRYLTERQGVYLPSVTPRDLSNLSAAGSGALAVGAPDRTRNHR